MTRHIIKGSSNTEIVEWSLGVSPSDGDIELRANNVLVAYVSRNDAGFVLFHDKAIKFVGKVDILHKEE